jgi:hypothetical protein
MSRSTTAGYLPRSKLELRRAATIIFASQLEAYLRAVNLSGSRYGNSTVSPTIPPQMLDAEADLIPVFTDRMWIVLCLEVTAVDVEHTLARKTYFVFPQNVM